MKYIIVILFLSISHFLFSQHKKTIINQKKIGPLNCSYNKFINAEKKDTIYALILSFRNAKYTNVNDTKLILIPKNDSLAFKELIKNLKEALSAMGAKTSMTWDKPYYSITISELVETMIFGDSTKSNGGYCLIEKTDVGLLIKWLGSFNFGKG